MTYDYLTPVRGEGKLSIAMVCDFFYPNPGGVETHTYCLAQCLIQRGHRVIVITHSRGPDNKQRQGVRYMGRGLKVYYIPMVAFYKQTVFFTLLGTLPIIREILIREQVDIVHGHSTFSCLSLECIVHAPFLGCRGILTDHSLSGFADLSAVSMNCLISCLFTVLDSMICVSHVCKENSVLRTSIDPGRVFVIPNAIDTFLFFPDHSVRDRNYVNIVVVSRLVYRKGIDLLVAIIPPICALFPQVRFLIGGDGPKHLALEELRERYRLHSRVKLLGGLCPDTVRPVLIQGDIFLNTSLTEAFCIAILEAVACGLLVVSTCVGGISEVLPEEFIRLCPARPADLAKCLSDAIRDVLDERQSHQDGSSSKNDDVGNTIVSSSHVKEVGRSSNFRCSDISTEKSWQMHEWIRQAYSWPEVARRTEAVYLAAVAEKPLNFKQVLLRLSDPGGWKGCVLVILALMYWVFLQFVCWLRPESTIYKVPYLPDPFADVHAQSVESNNTESEYTHLPS